jgi:hypothetical protein
LNRLQSDCIAGSITAGAKHKPGFAEAFPCQAPAAAIPLLIKQASPGRAGSFMDVMNSTLWTRIEERFIKLSYQFFRRIQWRPAAAGFCVNFLEFLELILLKWGLNKHEIPDSSYTSIGSAHGRLGRNQSSKMLLEFLSTNWQPLNRR